MSTSSAMPIHVGDVIAAKYRIQRPLAEGGMGAVFAAEHLDLGELRAIKFMFPAAAANPLNVERFLREARAASRLKSKHLARVHDIGRTESGLPYIVMEFLEGADLRSMLRSHRCLPVEIAVRYVRQACEAIGEAHAIGVVHRDIKPANIFITKGPRGEDCVKVLDFGIAKIMTGSEDAALTGFKDAFGTPLYMSPEQLRSTRAVDERTDVWSLGVLLFRMLVGRVPFPGESIGAICSSVLADTPPVPSSMRNDVPPDLDHVILRCLSKDPAGRYANANQLDDALAALGSSPPAVHEQSIPLDKSASFAAPLEAGRPSVPSAMLEAGRPSVPSAVPSAPKAVGRHGTEIMLSRPSAPPADYGFTEGASGPVPSASVISAAPPGAPRTRRSHAIAIVTLIVAAIGIVVAILIAASRPGNRDAQAPASSGVTQQTSSTSPATASSGVTQQTSSTSPAQDAPATASQAAPSSASSSTSSALPEEPTATHRPGPTVPASPANPTKGSGSSSSQATTSPGVIDPWASPPPKVPR